VLTHPRIQQHPNIVQLLSYDLIENGNNIFSPAFVIERATLGSLSDVLDAKFKTLTPDTRTSIISDVNSGLLALHCSDVVHGDIKTDNVLVFPSHHAPFMIAKLTDFGSIIPLGQAATGSNTKYYGTRKTNSPEVGHQSTTFQLDSIGLLRCDSYSLGLLIIESIIGSLPDDLTSKDDAVLGAAIGYLERSDLSFEQGQPIRKTLELLLCYEPDKRCYDLALIENVVRPARMDSIALLRWEHHYFISTKLTYVVFLKILCAVSRREISRSISKLALASKTILT
jgi:serine/threonine protein kinase